jgi:tetraprenyl-beta-curcumene synthase
VCARRWSRPRSHPHRAVVQIRTAFALARAVSRELTWGLHGAAREVAHWSALAEAIPDPALREDAREAIHHKRANIEGAVLFSTIAKRRSTDLLRALVAFEVLADYLDCTSERGAFVGVHNGQQLHCALVDALDAERPVVDYYRFHPWHDDDGFAAALVETCRRAYTRLPSYDATRPFGVRAATLAQVLALNHDEDPERRDELLRSWAAAHFPGDHALAWFEHTGAASAWLTVLALLALAADERRCAREARAVFDAYLPWISLAGTLLDSYGDQEADAENGAHRYVGHYGDAEVMTRRIGEVVRRAVGATSELPHGARHRVLVSAMAAMYLTKDSVWAPAWRRRTRALIRASGPLTRLLIPALRTWRVVNKQQAS